MVLTESERKARRLEGAKRAEKELSAVEKIHRALVNGRPPASELRTSAEAVSAARVLHRELEMQMKAAGLDPKPGDWLVRIAYVTTDFSMAFTLPYVPGKESELMERLTSQPVIMLGLLFGMRDRDAKDPQSEVIVGIKAFLVTRQTAAWLGELASQKHDGMN